MAAGSRALQPSRLRGSAVARGRTSVGRAIGPTSHWGPEIGCRGDWTWAWLRGGLGGYGEGLLPTLLSCLSTQRSVSLSRARGRDGLRPRGPAGPRWHLLTEGRPQRVWSRELVNVGLALPVPPPVYQTRDLAGSGRSRCNTHLVQSRGEAEPCAGASEAQWLREPPRGQGSAGTRREGLRTA